MLESYTLVWASYCTLPRTSNCCWTCAGGLFWPDRRPLNIVAFAAIGNAHPAWKAGDGAAAHCGSLLPMGGNRPPSRRAFDSAESSEICWLRRVTCSPAWSRRNEPFNIAVVGLGLSMRDLCPMLAAFGLCAHAHRWWGRVLGHWNPPLLPLGCGEGLGGGSRCRPYSLLAPGTSRTRSPIVSARLGTRWNSEWPTPMTTWH